MLETRSDFPNCNMTTMSFSRKRFKQCISTMLVAVQLCTCKYFRVNMIKALPNLSIILPHYTCIQRIFFNHYFAQRIPRFINLIEDHNNSLGLLRIGRERLTIFIFSRQKTDRMMLEQYLTLLVQLMLSLFVFL